MVIQWTVKNKELFEPTKWYKLTFFFIRLILIVTCLKFPDKTKTTSLRHKGDACILQWSLDQAHALSVLQVLDQVWILELTAGLSGPAPAASESSWAHGRLGGTEASAPTADLLVQDQQLSSWFMYICWFSVWNTNTSFAFLKTNWWAKTFVSHKT